MMTDQTPQWMVDRSAVMDARRIYDENNIGELIGISEQDDLPDCDGDTCRL